jgi:hypothetical protein
MKTRDKKKKYQRPSIQIVEAEILQPIATSNMDA